MTETSSLTGSIALFEENEYYMKKAIWDSIPKDIRPNGFGRKQRKIKDGVLEIISGFVKPVGKELRFCESKNTEHTLRFETDAVYKGWTWKEYHDYHWEYKKTE
jgi:hypothetical protein